MSSAAVVIGALSVNFVRLNFFSALTGRRQRIPKEVCLAPTGNVVVICKFHYINTLKQELGGTTSYRSRRKKNEISVVIQPLSCCRYY